MLPSYGVLIPTHNRYLSCLRAVRSALGQTVPPKVVVVVDDASSDERYEWLREVVNDTRVIVLRQPIRAADLHKAKYAVGAARNPGLVVMLEMKLDWIAFLDDDDEWMPDKMEQCLQAAGQHRGFGLVGTNAINRVDAVCSDFPHHHPWRAGRMISDDRWDVTAELTCDVPDFNPIICSSAVVATDVARQVGLQKETGFGEDWDYWRRSAQVAPALVVNRPLLYYAIGNLKHYDPHG
jgi:glycosyltransferase involved in cell wall biosynthesis